MDNPEIALYEPLIPQNTGNIGRMTLGFNTKLHLIGKLGFSLDNKYLKRAGLDYWKEVSVMFHKNFDVFYDFCRNKNKKIYCFSKKGKTNLIKSDIEMHSILLFGSEKYGMEGVDLDKYFIETIYIKMNGNIRSHNLSNTVAMALYDVYSKRELIND